MPTEWASLLFDRPRFALANASAFLRLFFCLLLFSATMLHFRCFQHADACSPSWSSKKAIRPWHTVRMNQKLSTAEYRTVILTTLRTYYPETFFLVGAFAESRKSPIIFVTSVCLPTCTSMAPTTPHISLTVDMTDFFTKICPETQTLVKIGKFT
jgi:hypothetical protein